MEGPKVEFRSQFELARPTASYKEMINKLPMISVGAEEKLNRIIPLLCSAAKSSLKENGLHVPPWRKPAYVRSKWLSKAYKKVSVSPEDIDSVLMRITFIIMMAKLKKKMILLLVLAFLPFFSRDQLQFC